MVHCVFTLVGTAFAKEKKKKRMGDRTGWRERGFIISLFLLPLGVRCASEMGKAERVCCRWLC